MLTALRRGWEVTGIRDGFNGLMFPDDYPESGGTVSLTREFVRGIGHLGGTVLGSTNRSDPTNFPVHEPDGSWTYVDRTDELVGLFKEAGIEPLITIGGDGSLLIGQKLSEAGRFAIVVVAEGAKPKDGELSVIGKSVGQAERLGGVGAHVAEELEALTGKEVRTMVLGHLLRGGTPSSRDRLLGVRFGTAAVRGLEDGHRGVMVALEPPTMNYVPLVSAISKMRVVPNDCDTIVAARGLGISFGD